LRKEEEIRKREEERKKRIEESLRKQREEEEEKIRLQREEIDKKKMAIEQDRSERERKRRLIEQQLENTRVQTTQKIEDERSTMIRIRNLEQEISNRNQMQQSRPLRGSYRSQRGSIRPQRGSTIGPVRNIRNRYESEDNDPFYGVDELDSEVIYQYKSRNSLIFGKNLPSVIFKKGRNSGEYIIGQRRFKVQLINGDLKVVIGKNLLNFSEFIERQERIEALKAKALNSGGMLLSFFN